MYTVLKHLSAKRILLIAPSFFGYHDAIRRSLEMHGAHVCWIPDRPFESVAMAAFSKVAPVAAACAAEEFYQRNIGDAQLQSFDIILIVNGQTVSIKTLKWLRAEFPRARRILYLWDSVANRPSTAKSFAEFDDIYTFDRSDALAYGIKYRPLFFPEDMNFPVSSVQEIRYDATFIGTAHADRCAVLSRLFHSVNHGARLYAYMYLQAQWVYYYSLLARPGVRNFRKSDFKFHALPREQVRKLFSESVAIIDIQHPRQSGLTMRTLEALGARKKIITTNKAIREADFYSEEQIVVVDRINPIFPRRFLQQDGGCYDEGVRDRYTINSWLAELIAKGV